MPATARLLASFGLLWLVAVAVFAFFEGRHEWDRVSGLALVNDSRAASLRLVLGLVAASLVVSIGTGWFAPRWWRRAMLLMVVAPVPVLLVTSGNVLAGITAAGVLAPFLWYGRESATRVLGISRPSDAWIAGAGLGLMALSAAGIALAVCGALRPVFIYLLLLLLTLGLVLSSRKRLLQDLRQFADLLAAPVASPLEILAAAGLLVGFYWLALIGALAPEFMSDAVRVRLPVSALLARTGGITIDPDLAISARPGLGEFLYAILLAIGPLESVKIFNFLIGLACAASVWCLGRHLGGERAGVFALLAFGSLPLVVWQAQIAYVDLFATLFTLTAALVLVIAPGIDARTVIVALGCLLAGLAVKSSFILLAPGLAVMIVLIVMGQLSGKSGTLAAVITVIGLVAVALWITGNYLVLAQVPALSPAVMFLTNARGQYVGVLPELDRTASATHWQISFGCHSTLYKEPTSTASTRPDSRAFCFSHSRRW